MNALIVPDKLTPPNTPNHPNEKTRLNQAPVNLNNDIPADALTDRQLIAVELLAAGRAVTVVARTLEVGTIRRAFTVILPAAAPTILTGMRISIGIAWLVIVAAEMLVGGTGIGYFVWNEWNNLSITNVIIAILLIGIVGMLLDQILARFTRMVTFPE